MSKEVITFTDASTEAYGCTVYVRCEYDNHEVTCRLVASKSSSSYADNSTEVRADGCSLGTAASTIRNCGAGNTNT